MLSAWAIWVRSIWAWAAQGSRNVAAVKPPVVSESKLRRVKYLISRHSGAEQSEEPGIHNRKSGNMDSGLAAELVIGPAKRPDPLAAIRNDRLARLCGFLGVPPPYRRERRPAVFRHRIRTAEAVPARGPHFVVGPLRHDVMVPQQDAVERPGGGFEVGAVLGVNDVLDHGVDGRILDADDVVGSGLVGGLRAPIAALFVAGRQRFGPPIGDNVEIPSPQPIDEWRFVDGARACC